MALELTNVLIPSFDNKNDKDEEIRVKEEYECKIWYPFDKTLNGLSTTEWENEYASLEWDDEKCACWEEDAECFEETSSDDEHHKLMSEIDKEQKNDDEDFDGLYAINGNKSNNINIFCNIGFEAKLKVQPQDFVILDDANTFESDYILNRKNIIESLHNELHKYNLDDKTRHIIIDFMYNKQNKLKYEIKFIHQQNNNNDSSNRSNYDLKWLFDIEIIISSFENNKKLYCLRFNKIVDEEINEKIYPITYEDEFDAPYPQSIYLKKYTENHKDNKIVIGWCFKNEYQSEIGRSYLICNLLYRYDENNPFKNVQQNVFELTKWKLYKGAKQVYNEHNLYHPVYPYICGYSLGPYNHDIMYCLGIQGRFRSTGYVKWNKKCKSICRGEGTNDENCRGGGRGGGGCGIGYVDNCKWLRKMLKKLSKNEDLNGFYPYYDKVHDVCWLYVIINGNELLKIYMNRWTLYEKKVIKNLPSSDIDIEYNIGFLKDFWVITASNDVEHDKIYAIAGTKWIVKRDWSVAYPFNTDKRPFAMLTA